VHDHRLKFKSSLDPGEYIPELLETRKAEDLHQTLKTIRLWKVNHTLTVRMDEWQQWRKVFLCDGEGFRYGDDESLRWNDWCPQAR